MKIISPFYFILAIVLSACSINAQAENNEQFILGKFISSDIYERDGLYYSLGVYEKYTYTDFRKDENGVVLIKLGAATKKRFFLSMQIESEFIKGNEDIADAKKFWEHYNFIYAKGYSTDVKHPSPDFDEVMFFESLDIFSIEMISEVNKGIWLKAIIGVD